MEFMNMEEEKKRMNPLQMCAQIVLRVVLVGLFLSSPNWVPCCCPSVKSLSAVWIPRIGAFVSEPKCVFVVSNIIVVFLVGESRRCRSAAQPDVYEEYARRSRRVESLANGDVNEGEASGGGGVAENSCEERNNEEDDEEEGLPAEELNRRVEDFIARINMQRKLEARMLDRCI